MQRWDVAVSMAAESVRERGTVTQKEWGNLKVNGMWYTSGGG